MSQVGAHRQWHGKTVGTISELQFTNGGLLTTDVLQAMANKPQHWDWGQTEITSPIFTLCSVIDYYHKRGLTVNLCMLEISKAFDKVNHYCMFIKLMNRSVQVCSSSKCAN